MRTYLALLRGINVGGHKQVGMADLRDLLAQLGLVDVRSLLQSGNLVFRSESRSPAQLERLLESEAKKRLELQTHFMVRTAEEWRTGVLRNPLRKEDEQMGGISLGLLAERIAQHHRPPFLGGANHEMGLKLQALLGLGLEEALELGGAS